MNLGLSFAQDDFREEIRKETILNSDYIIEGTATQYYVWYNQEKDEMYITKIVEVGKIIKGSIQTDDNLVLQPKKQEVDMY